MATKFADSLFLALFIAAIAGVVFSAEYGVAAGDHCYSCMPHGIKTCCMTGSDPCPSSIPVCGEVKGGDGCSCKS